MQPLLCIVLSSSFLAGVESEFWRTVYNIGKLNVLLVGFQEVL